MSGDPTRPENQPANQPADEPDDQPSADSLFGEPPPEPMQRELAPAVAPRAEPSRIIRPQPRPEQPPQSPPAPLFGEIEPPQAPPRDRYARGRAAEREIDAHFQRTRKRIPIVRWVAITLFTLVIAIPVGWVLLYGILNPPTTATMLIRAAQGEAIRYEFVPLQNINPAMVRSVIAAEDAKFCTHDGFDIEAIEKAIEHNEQGGRQRGASTISQQTAKNLFLWTGGGWFRKAVETYFTFLIENLWSKRRIMELYLNVAEFGDGMFGAEAAAQGRFGVSAARLTRLQAARLAAVLPSPNRYNAARPGPYVRRQSATIMARANVVGGSEGGDDCVLGR